MPQCPETNNRSVPGRSSAAPRKCLQALAILFYCSSSKPVNCKHKSGGEGTLPAAKDNRVLYNPAKSLIQQFSAGSRLALSHLESLWFGELPGADHQNRLYFHFPFQITGGTCESRQSFSLYLPWDAIPRADPARAPAEPEAPWEFPAGSGCRSLRLAWAAVGTPVPLQLPSRML